MDVMYDVLNFMDIDRILGIICRYKCSNGTFIKKEIVAFLSTSYNT